MVSRKTLDAHIGKKYNRLTVISIGEPRKRCDGRNHNTVNCICECGKEGNYKLTEVVSGHSGSCGCLRRDNTKKAKTTHGQTDTPLYYVYNGMKARCYDDKKAQYKDYGGRGIKVCDEWLENPSSFFEWALNNGYKRGLHIDRENNNGNYDPSNCRWVTRKVNNRNTRRSKYVTYKGETKVLADWCDELGLEYLKINHRLWRGWNVERAFETPLR